VGDPNRGGVGVVAYLGWVAYERALKNESFTVCKNWLALGGTVFLGSGKSQMAKLRDKKTCLIQAPAVTIFSLCGSARAEIRISEQVTLLGHKM
jgi:hypothetical protein